MNWRKRAGETLSGGGRPTRTLDPATVGGEAPAIWKAGGGGNAPGGPDPKTNGGEMPAEHCDLGYPPVGHPRLRKVLGWRRRKGYRTGPGAARRCPWKCWDSGKDSALPRLPVPGMGHQAALENCWGRLHSVFGAEVQDWQCAAGAADWCCIMRGAGLWARGAPCGP